MSFESWELAMGMNGYVGSPAEREDRREATRLSWVQKEVIKNIARGRLPHDRIENRKNWRTVNTLKRRGFVEFENGTDKYALTERGWAVMGALSADTRGHDHE